MHFWGTSDCCMGIICMHTPTKLCLAVILRGQPSFYVHRFTRYEFSDFFAPPGLFPANRLWPKICHLLFLALLESYNQFLKRKWIYMEVHMGGNSAPRVHKNFTKSRFCVQSYYLFFSCKRFLYSRHRTVSNHQSSFI